MLKKKQSFVERSRDGGMPRVVGYFDFSKITEISTASAVILAAEYERIAKLQNEVPPTVDLTNWSQPVLIKLFQIGFFGIVGFTPKNEPIVGTGEYSKTMQIVSSKSANDLETIDKSLQSLGDFLNPVSAVPDEIIIEFLTALSEAISNVTNHAYPPDVSLGYEHIGSLWVAATADRRDKSLTVVVYDQGATIPTTYPRATRLDKVIKYLSRALRSEKEFDYENDGTYIRAAMRYGGSRTDMSHRGKGLPQMFDTLKRIGPGSLTVYSRGGWCQRLSEQRYISGAVPASIGGTLIEWNVNLA